MRCRGYNTMTAKGIITQRNVGDLLRVSMDCRNLLIAFSTNSRSFVAKRSSR